MPHSGLAGYRRGGGMTPADTLADQVLAALGRPCKDCSSAVLMVLKAPHDRHSFDAAARAAGLPTRQALTRRMQRHGFPPSRDLQDWLRTVTLIVTHGAQGRGPSTQAYHAGIEPATLRRAMLRATGLHWPQVKDLGLIALLGKLWEAIGENVRCGNLTGAE